MGVVGCERVREVIERMSCGYERIRDWIERVGCGYERIRDWIERAGCVYERIRDTIERLSCGYERIRRGFERIQDDQAAKHRNWAQSNKLKLKNNPQAYKNPGRQSLPGFHSFL